MPELPELEALAESLQTMRGGVVAAVDVRSPSVLKTYAPPIDELIGDRLQQIRRRGKWLRRVHRRQGQPCFVCSTPLAAIHLGERVTTYCPTCQSGGRVYADRRLSRLLR